MKSVKNDVLNKEDIEKMTLEEIKKKLIKCYDGISYGQLCAFHARNQIALQEYKWLINYIESCVEYD